MVEQSAYLDGIFSSLADPIRRDILRRLIDRSAQYSIRQIAAQYRISFAAVAKHVQVLEKAKLIVKERRGKEQIVRIAPQTLADASNYLAQYEALWNYRMDALENVLKEDI
ncbi:MAG TPA: helix-turn-helix domain-containing protein [Candidatus Saccharimonadales bacterium]|nr:helix-turn-helix domain-containing protein [Candidatus Saccharimonadales bacterium]